VKAEGIWVFIKGFLKSTKLKIIADFEAGKQVVTIGREHKLTMPGTVKCLGKCFAKNG
jgi:hypothetical protein